MCVIRRTTWEDIDEVMYIYQRAADFMVQTGNPRQWVNGYPGRSLIEADIHAGVSHVAEDDSGIQAVFSYIEGADPTYGRIERGSWRADGLYGTVHRLASAGKRRGLAGLCVDWCEAQARAHGCKSLRADTHQDNRIMQKLLGENAFVYCGEIYLTDGAARLAYERVW